MVLRNAFEELATEAKLEQVRVLLEALAPALETINAVITNWPADFPLPTTQVDTLKPLAVQPVSGDVTVSNFPAAIAEYPLPQAQVDELQQVTVSGEVTVAEIPDHNFLTPRMFAKQRADGYRLWIDTSVATRVIIAEAPVGTVNEALLVWRGILISKNADGKVVGEIKEREGFSWTDRGVGW